MSAPQVGTERAEEWPRWLWALWTLALVVGLGVEAFGLYALLREAL